MLKKLTRKQIDAMNAIRWWHRIAVGLDENGGVVYTPGEVHHGEDGGAWPRTRFGIPDDLTGKTVLDIGAWDGFFSFYCEERGAANVMAMDVPEDGGGHWGGATTGFDFAKKLRGSKVGFRSGNLQERDILELSSKDYDLVLCYGVLYHLDNPFTAIENLFVLTKPGGICLIETAVEMDRQLAHLESWNLHANHVGDRTNKWYPTRKGLIETCKRAEFAECEIIADIGERITVRCTKSTGSSPT
jgi:tRNA (mo5U34)-methyltransferase